MGHDGGIEECRGLDRIFTSEIGTDQKALLFRERHLLGDVVRYPLEVSLKRLTKIPVSAGELLDHRIQQVLDIVIAESCDALYQTPAAHSIPGDMRSRDDTRALGIQHRRAPLDELSPLFPNSHIM